jgi:hypothetical protein
MFKVFAKKLAGFYKISLFRVMVKWPFFNIFCYEKVSQGLICVEIDFYSGLHREFIFAITLQPMNM